MPSSIPPAGGGHKPHESSGLQLPKQALAGIKVTARDQHLPDTPWGKWFARMPGAPGDKDELIRMIKASIQQYCKMVTHEIQENQKKAKKAADMLKRVARGGSPEE